MNSSTTKQKDKNVKELFDRQKAAKEEIMRVTEAELFFEYWAKVAGLNELYSYFKGAVRRCYDNCKNVSQVTIAPVHCVGGIVPGLRFWEGDVQKQIYVCRVLDFIDTRNEQFAHIPDSAEILPGIFYHGQANEKRERFAFILEVIAVKEKTD